MPKKTEEKVETVAEIAIPEKVEVAVSVAPTPEYDFEVNEPLIIKPQDLPLVVTPGAGKSWANAEQAEYAKTLNGYAYKNPKKWARKKATLLKALTLLASDPGYINKLRGAEDENTRLTYSNKMIES